MELVVTLPFLFSFFILIQNIKNQAVTLFNLTIFGLSIYVMAHFFTNAKDYTFIAAALFNHFTPVYLIVGPCFYLFILKRLDKIKGIKRIHFLHFIPSIIQLISIIPYFLVPWEEKVNMLQEIAINPKIQEQLNINIFFSPQFNYAFRIFHFIIYCMISLNLILNKIKKTPNPDNEQLISLKKIAVIFILLSSIYFIHIIIILIGGSYRTTLLNIIIYLNMILFIGLMFELLKYPELMFSEKKFKHSYINKSPFSLNENERNLIPVDVYKNIETKINFMKKDRKFLIQPTTNFDVFSYEINENKYHIRLFLKHKGSSFIKLKNEIRIAEAISYLDSEKRYKLDYISEKCGFNSRSNFYKIFKDITGYTPSEYEKVKLK